MKIFHHLGEVPQDFGQTVLTIGNFDGVHRGHQLVIAEVIARARALNAKSLGVTFFPHPGRVLRPEGNLRLITPLPQKLALLAATGIDATLVIPFTPEFSHLSARDFAQRILLEKLHAVDVHEGENFRFGYQAEAGITGLAALGAELGFAVHSYTPRRLRGNIISSSVIRKFISAGEVHRARPLLGRPFSICSTPASGRGYGTRYTVPTINLAPYSELLPANGVYVTQLSFAGECFNAVTNIGNRPTFGPDSFAVESHLLNFHPIDLSKDAPLELAFLKRIRSEQKFDSPDLLRAQIMRDVAHADRYFSLAAAARSPSNSPA